VFLIVVEWFLIVIALGLSKPYRSLWGRVGIFDLLLQSRTPQKKQIIGGGPPFTIVDVTLIIIPVIWQLGRYKSARSK